MLVADYGQLASSATLGAEKADAMSFSDDPAMFLAMIANLYSNQKLAFVRETICNQVDGHIAAGIVDRPVYIHISDTYVITFRDYGNGIPVDKMKSTYNTLGGSTKRASVNETGGFGLGCKSPLAYADAFVVITMNNGVKAIYNMVKSAVELQGRPGLVPIVQTPTTESGVEVQIQLKKEDLGEIIGYIKSVVFNGEINAHFKCEALNHVYDGILPKLGMSFNAGSYDTDAKWFRNYMGNHRIYIRYANVIYPALFTPATEKAIDLMTEFANIIGCERLLIQAAPNTLALAPSRETLSSQKMTEDGVTDLIVAAVDKLEKDIKQGIPVAINEIKASLRAAELSNNWEYPNYANYISNRAVARYMTSGMWKKQFNHYRKDWNNLYANTLISLMHFKQGTNINHMHKVVKQSLRSERVHEINGAMRKYLATNVLRDFQQLGVTQHALMYAVKQGKGYPLAIFNAVSRNDFLYNNWYGNAIFTAALAHTKRVFITTRAGTLYESIGNYPNFAGNYASLIVRVGAKKGEADAMAAKLISKGYDVIDLTKGHEWDKHYTRRRADNAAKAAKRKQSKPSFVGKAGKPVEYKPNRLVSMSCMFDKPDEPNRARTTLACDTHWVDQVEVDKPTYYMDVSISSGAIADRHIYYAMIPQEIRDVTAVCRNKIEINKCINRGALPISAYAAKRVAETFKSKAFIKYVKHENIAILNRLGVEAEVLELLNTLDIKVPIIAKLRKDVLYESVIHYTEHSDYNFRKHLDKLVHDGHLSQDDNALIQAFDQRTAFVNVEAVANVAGLFSWREGGTNLLNSYDADSLIILLKEEPAIKPVLKQLVKYYLTENTKCKKIS